MSDFFECPVCGRTPKVRVYPPNIASAWCNGFGFRRHRRIGVSVYAQPSVLYRELTHHWNQIHFREARFLYDDESEIARLLGAAEGGSDVMSRKAEEIAAFMGPVPNHDVLIVGQKTNRDRYRAMTDAELASEISAFAYCSGCPIEPECNEDTTCAAAWLKYLKSPAEEEAEK